MRRAAAVFVSLLTLGSASVLARADSPGAMQGARFPASRAFVQKYCAGCHTKDGHNPKHARAYRILQLDTYAEWKDEERVLTAVLDKWHLDGKIMPPPDSKNQPSDAERRAIVEWLGRGSPNTPDGK